MKISPNISFGKTLVATCQINTTDSDTSECKIFELSNKEDKDYLYNLEKNIDVDFPEEFTIVTSDWTRGEQTSSDNTLLRYETVVRFSENTNLTFDEKWIDELTINEMLPTLFILQTTNYEKFMIYCFDTKEYNPQSINKDYEYVAIAYDEDNNNLLIYEFYLK